jgi:hypothetical protein
LPRGAEGVAGEQASEFDYFERIAQVRSVGLQAHRTLFPLVEIGAHSDPQARGRRYVKGIGESS